MLFFEGGEGGSSPILRDQSSKTGVFGGIL